jgi:hypothetical protein
MKGTTLVQGWKLLLWLWDYTSTKVWASTREVGQCEELPEFRGFCGSLAGTSYSYIVLFDSLVKAWRRPGDCRTPRAKITIITAVSTVYGESAGTVRSTSPGLGMGDS